MQENIWDFIQKHANDDVRILALQAAKYPEIDMPFALQQITGRQKAKYKIPIFYNNPLTQYPQLISLEQCSSEQTALYKAMLVEGKNLLDMTGGFGIDTFFLSEKFNEVIYSDKNASVRTCAEHNFILFGKKNIHISKCNDGIQTLKELNHIDCVFIDPARRNTNGKKVVSIADCEPDIIPILPLLQEKTDTVLIKLSPMLDISRALEQLPQTQAIHVVAVDNECKELLFLLQFTKKTKPVIITAVNLSKQGTQTFTFTKQQEQIANIKYAVNLKKYLYEPNAAVLKAGAFKSISLQYNMEKLHSNTHLYTSDELHSDFCGRIFEIESSFGLQKQEVLNLQKTVSKANIAIRNFPENTENLRKKLKIADGGDVYLFACTLHNNQRNILKCRKV